MMMMMAGTAVGRAYSVRGHSMSGAMGMRTGERGTDMAATGMPPTATMTAAAGTTAMANATAATTGSGRGESRAGDKCRDNQ